MEQNAAIRLAEQRCEHGVKRGKKLRNVALLEGFWLTPEHALRARPNRSIGREGA